MVSCTILPAGARPPPVFPTHAGAPRKERKTFKYIHRTTRWSKRKHSKGRQVQGQRYAYGETATKRYDAINEKPGEAGHAYESTHENPPLQYHLSRPDESRNQQTHTPEEAGIRRKPRGPLSHTPSPPSLSHLSRPRPAPQLGIEVVEVPLSALLGQPSRHVLRHGGPPLPEDLNKHKLRAGSASARGGGDETRAVFIRLVTTYVRRNNCLGRGEQSFYL